MSMLRLFNLEVLNFYRMTYRIQVAPHTRAWSGIWIRLLVMDSSMVYRHERCISHELNCNDLWEDNVTVMQTLLHRKFPQRLKTPYHSSVIKVKHSQYIHLQQWRNKEKQQSQLIITNINNLKTLEHYVLPTHIHTHTCMHINNDSN